MTTAASALLIDLWHGREQRFGHLGNPQQFVNVLGRVHPVARLAALTYSLNKKPAVQLAIGPDQKRLQSPGDFNIELDINELLPGDNTVVVTARDTNGKLYSEAVTLHYQPDQVWPLPYEVDWKSVGAIGEAAQVVDGHWEIGEAGARTCEIGYDRLIAIGDRSWRYYDVRVALTVHGFGPLDQWGPGVGVLLHWQGHYDWKDGTPRSGWWPIGALGWYLHLSRWGDYRLNFFGNRSEVLAEDASGKQLLAGAPYMMRLRAEPNPGRPTRYRLKLWPATESEPTDWDISGTGPEDELSSGCLLLLAHHTDVSFGKVRVEPVA